MPYRFYLDEDFPVALVALLLALGHDAVSTGQLGNKGVRDHRQHLLSAQMERIFVTYDGDDYGLLHDAWRVWSAAWETAPSVARHAGMLVVQQDKSGLTTDMMATEIDAIVGRAGPLDNRLFAWTRTKGWHEIEEETR